MRLTTYLKHPMVRCLAAGVIAAIAMQIPLIGLLLALLAAPLMLLVPELGSTGDHVEIGFAWIGLTSTFAWLAYIAYFGALFAALARLFRFIRNRFKRT